MKDYSREGFSGNKYSDLAALLRSNAGDKQGKIVNTSSGARWMEFSLLDDPYYIAVNCSWDAVRWVADQLDALMVNKDLFISNKEGPKHGNCFSVKRRDGSYVPWPETDNFFVYGIKKK